MIGLKKLQKCCTPSSPTKETNTSQKNLILVIYHYTSCSDRH